jgi:hypothetical protein
MIGRSTTMSDDEKMLRPKSSLTGRAETATSNLDYDGLYFTEAWSILERKFGQAHVLVGAQLEKLQAYPAVRMHSSEAIVAYATFVEGFVHTLQIQGYEVDLRGVITLNLAVAKLPPDLTTRWYEYFTTKGIQQPSVKEFADWLSSISMAHERLLASKPAASQQTSHTSHQQINRPRETQSYNSHPRSYPQQQQQQRYTGNSNPVRQSSGFAVTSSQRPRAGMQNRPDLEKFKDMTFEQRTDEVKRLRLCFCCLQPNHFILQCKNIRPCGIEGCMVRHHPLLHRTDKETVNNLATDKPGGRATGLLPILRVRVRGPTGKSTETYALLDTGSTISWIDKKLVQELRLKGEELQLPIISFGNEENVQTQELQVKISSPSRSQLTNVQVFSRENLSVGQGRIDLTETKRKHPHLRRFPDDSIDYKKVKLLLGQNCFRIIQPLEVVRDGVNSLFAVRTPLGWTLSGTLSGTQSGALPGPKYSSCNISTIAPRPDNPIIPENNADTQQPSPSAAPEGPHLSGAGGQNFRLRGIDASNTKKKETSTIMQTTRIEGGEKTSAVTPVDTRIEEDVSDAIVLQTPTAIRQPNVQTQEVVLTAAARIVTNPIIHQKTRTADAVKKNQNPESPTEETTNKPINPKEHKSYSKNNKQRTVAEINDLKRVDSAKKLPEGLPAIRIKQPIPERSSRPRHTKTTQKLIKQYSHGQGSQSGSFDTDFGYRLTDDIPVRTDDGNPTNKPSTPKKEDTP